VCVYESAELPGKTVEVALTAREVIAMLDRKQQLFLICQTNLLDLLHTAKKLRGQAVENHKFYGLIGLKERWQDEVFEKHKALRNAVQRKACPKFGVWLCVIMDQLTSSPESHPMMPMIAV